MQHNRCSRLVPPASVRLAPLEPCPSWLPRQTAFCLTPATRSVSLKRCFALCSGFSPGSRQSHHFGLFWGRVGPGDLLQRSSTVRLPFWCPGLSGSDRMRPFPAPSPPLLAALVAQWHCLCELAETCSPDQSEIAAQSLLPHPVQVCSPGQSSRQRMTPMCRRWSSSLTAVVLPPCIRRYTADNL